MGHHALESAAQRPSPRVVATSAPPVPLPLGGVGNRAMQSLLGTGETEGRSLDPVVRRQLEAPLGTDLGRSPPAIAGTAPGVARQPEEGGGGQASEVDDSLGGVGESVVDLVSHGMAGTGLQQRMLQAAMRGFVAELGRQLKPGEQAARFKSSLKELAVPGNLARFAGGYAGGAVAGFVSPVTDLLGLGALVEQLPAIAVNLGRRAWQQASVLADESRELAKNVAEFTAFAKSKVAELLRDPAQLYALLDSVGPRAVTAAGEAGRSAARQIVGFFTSKDEQEEKPDESLRQALTTTTEAEKSGFFSFLTSKATRLRKLAFSTPWAKFGYDVGHAVGAVVSNLLLLVFSEGIGNAIAKVGSWLGEVAPLLARGAKGLVQLGRVVAASEQAVGLAISKGLKLAKPLEAIVAPLLRLFERFQGFLRRLFGVAEREGATLAARGGAAAAEEAGSRMARPPAAAAEVVPIKGPSSRQSPSSPGPSRPSSAGRRRGAAASARSTRSDRRHPVPLPPRSRSLRSPCPRSRSRSPRPGPRTSCPPAAPAAPRGRWPPRRAPASPRARGRRRPGRWRGHR